MTAPRVVALALVLLLAGAALSPAAACAVCYGDSDSLMTAGMNNAILVLLGVVVLVQGGFVALFVSFRRRARRLRERRARFELIDGGAR